jgi:tRNA 5-methylaminomethyl-2-thiouridine biosynthesis bifunctional protein
MTTCIIIGGGLAGTALAMALSRRGCNSTIIEASSIASAASGNPAALAVRDTGRLEVPLQRDILGYSALISAVEEHRAAGRVFDAVFGTAIQFPVTERLNRRVAQEGVAANFLSELAGVSVNNSALVQEGVCVNPVELCRAHVEASRAQVVVGSVYRLDWSRGLWSASTRSGEFLAQASFVCIANAADAVSLEQSAWLKLERVRGQIVLINQTMSELPRIPVCFDGYVLPLSKGGHLIGADYDHLSWDYRIHPQISRALLDKMRRWIAVPPVPESFISGRVAFRATTHDRYPYVGHLPDYDTFRLHAKKALSAQRPVAACDELLSECPILTNCFVSVGHGSRGLVSAHYAAEVIADNIAGPISGTDSLILDSALSPKRLLSRLLRDLRGKLGKGKKDLNDE